MSDAALPNPIPPLDASPEIKAMARRCEGNAILHEDDGRPYAAKEFRDVATFLRRLGEREARTWRPIESAPRDGTEILVTNWRGPDRFYSVDLARWTNLSGDDDEKDWWCRNRLPAYPTHWQPLPAPPAALAAGKEGE